MNHCTYSRNQIVRRLFYLSFCNFPLYRKYIYAEISPDTVSFKPHYGAEGKGSEINAGPLDLEQFLYLDHREGEKRK